MLSTRIGLHRIELISKTLVNDDFSIFKNQHFNLCNIHSFEVCFKITSDPQKTDVALSADCDASYSQDSVT